MTLSFTVRLLIHDVKLASVVVNRDIYIISDKVRTRLTLYFFLKPNANTYNA